MRRSRHAFQILLALSLFAVVGHARPQPPGSDSPADMQVNGKASPCVRLRSGASLDRPIVDCLEAGVRLRELGSISGWSHVRLTDGTEGWIDSTYLEPAPATPAAPPAAEAITTTEPAGDLESQIRALRQKLEAAAARREAMEGRLQATVAVAEEAQLEASRLRQQVEQLEGEAARRGDPEVTDDEVATLRSHAEQLEARLADSEGKLVRAAEATDEQERRIETLDAELAAAVDREEEQRRAAATAEKRLAAAQQESAARAARIEQLEAAPAPDPPRNAELKRQLKEARAQLRQARKENARLASRLAELEAELAAAQGREADLRQALTTAEQRLAAAEQLHVEQARRIETLTGQLADAELRLAEAELKSRLAERTASAPAVVVDEPVSVRAPIVAAPEPSKVSVRMPAVTPEPPETAAPVPAVAAAAEMEAPTDDPSRAIAAAIDIVHAWAAAWSDQRVDEYLSYYGPDFEPPDGLGRDVWEAQRRLRLNRPSYIRVTISELTAGLAEDGTVTATFRQEYESDAFADIVTKELTLVEDDGTWRLMAEVVRP